MKKVVTSSKRRFAFRVWPTGRPNHQQFSTREVTRERTIRITALRQWSGRTDPNSVSDVQETSLTMKRCRKRVLLQYIANTLRTLSKDVAPISLDFK